MRERGIREREGKKEEEERNGTKLSITAWTLESSLDLQTSLCTDHIPCCSFFFLPSFILSLSLSPWVIFFFSPFWCHTEQKQQKSKGKGNPSLVLNEGWERERDFDHWIEKRESTHYAVNRSGSSLWDPHSLSLSLSLSCLSWYFLLSIYLSFLREEWRWFLNDIIIASLFSLSLFLTRFS